MQKLPDFVRRLSPDMLNAYCADRDLPFKTKKVKSEDPDARQGEFLSFLNGLTDPMRRQSVEADFDEVHDMSTNKGCQLLVQVARMEKLELPKKMEEDWTPPDIAMWFYLNAPEQFQMAVPEYALTQSAGWTPFRVTKTVDGKAVHDARDHLITRISRYFETKEGRGQHCKMDFIERNDFICAVANPANYTQREYYFGKTGNLDQSFTFKPPFRVYFLYRPAERVLLVKSNGRSKQRSELADIFAREVLKQGLSRFDIINYDLNHLINRDFTYPIIGGLVSASVTSLTVKYPVGVGLVLGFSTTYKEHGVSRLARDMAARNVRASDVDVVKAKIVMKFEGVPNLAKREKQQVTVDLTTENCTLGCKPIDDMARAVLKEWGIMLQDEHDRQTAENDTARSGELQPA